MKELYFYNVDFSNYHLIRRMLMEYNHDVSVQETSAWAEKTNDNKYLTFLCERIGHHNNLSFDLKLNK